MVLIQLLLPARVWTAGAVEDMSAAFARTRAELVDAFDGVTAYVRSPAQGVWTAPDGRQERDEVIMVEVVTARFDRVWWREYAATLAERFKQDLIHVRALPVAMLTEEEDP